MLQKRMIAPTDGGLAELIQSKASQIAVWLS